MGGVVSTLFGGSSIENTQLQNLTQAAQPGLNQYNNATTNAQGGISQQQALVNALAAQNGVQNQSDVYNQLQGVANGTGANPALAQLNQSTGQNVQNQAALMAGQRGAGTNAGLIARQAAQQGASTQQQSAGQAATLQAQQSLNALSQMGSLSTSQVNQQQSGLNSLNSQLSNQQNSALNYTNALGGLSSQQNAQQLGLSQAQTQQANARTGMWGNILGSAASAAMANGGQVANSQTAAPILKENYKGKSRLGSALYAKGGKISVMVSPGEHILTPAQAKKAEAGKANPMKSKEVKGKAAVGGAVNDYANDNVPMRLSPGSVVLPRSVTKSEHSKEKAEKFVQALKSKKGKK